MRSKEGPKSYPSLIGVVRELRHFLPSGCAPLKRAGEMVRAHMLRTILTRKPDQPGVTVFEILRPQVTISIEASERGDRMAGPLEEKHLTAINGALQSGLEIVFSRSGAGSSGITTAKISDTLEEGLVFNGSGKDVEAALRNAAVKMISRQGDTQPKISEVRVEDPADINLDNLDRLLKDGKTRVDIRFFEGEVIIVARDHIFRGPSFEETCKNAVLEDSITREAPPSLKFELDVKGNFRGLSRGGYSISDYLNSIVLPFDLLKSDGIKRWGGGGISEVGQYHDF